MADGARALMSLALCVTAGCGRSPVHAPDGGTPPPVAITLDHLRHLTSSIVVAGDSVRVVAIYADAPDYDPTPSPARDGSEGIASVDDAARAAVLWLREYEFSRDTIDRDEALGLLRFVVAMEQGDGEFLNFVDARGRPNRTAPSSRKSMSFWAARSIWALGESVRVLGSDAPERLQPFRPTLDRAVSRMTREIDAGRLIGGSATATSEALLGLLALYQAEPSAELRSLASRTAALIAPLSRGGGDSPPWGAHVDPGEPWHAWGARSVAALATAAEVLEHPEHLDAARREADGLWSRFLLAGAVPALVSGDGQTDWYPQIAYGIASVVDGYLALSRATGERRYAQLAGLTAGWLLGSNAAGVAMYDERSGRTFDGIDAPSGTATVNRNAGAESTIEALLALQGVMRAPEAAVFLRFRPVGPRTPLAQVPGERHYIGPADDTLSLHLDGAREPLRIVEPAEAAPVTLTYWPAANPAEVRLATRLTAEWNRRHPSIQVRVQPLPAGRSSEEVLLAAIVARATPDVSSNVSSALLARLVLAEGVVRLDRLTPTAARLLERTTAEMLVPLRLPDDGIYAMPWKTNPELLMYNVDLLADAGIGPPGTHAELLEAFRRLARDTDGDGRLDRWAMWAPLKTTWHERFHDFYPLYLASSGGRTLVHDGEVLFDNRAADAAIEVLRHGFAEGLLPRANFSLGRDPFIDGTVAMKFIGSWFLYELEQLKPPDLRYAVAPIPRADWADASDRYAFADMRNIAIFSTTRHPEAAARFVAYLTSPDADRLLIEEASQLPYRRDVIDDRRFTAALRRWPSLSTYAAHIERTRDLDIHPDVIEIFDLISEAYEAAGMYGIVPVRDAVRAAADEARKIVDAR